MKIKWNQMLHALVLVKIGQDLGTHCQLTQSIHDIIETFAQFIGAFTKL